MANKNFTPRGSSEAKQASDVPSVSLFGGQSLPKEKPQATKEIPSAESDDPYICIGLGCSCSVE